MASGNAGRYLENLHDRLGSLRLAPGQRITCVHEACLAHVAWCRMH